MITGVSEREVGVKWRMRVIAALLISCVSVGAHGQSRVDILQIWQNFIASGVAATECGSGESPAKQKFAANLTDVSIGATQALQQREPSATQEQIVSRMKTVGEDIHEKVEAEIKQNGCSSPKIVQLLAMYKMHSEMNF